MAYFLCLKPTTAPMGWHEPKDGLIAVPDEKADQFRELKHLYRECDETGMPLDEKPKPSPVEEGDAPSAEKRERAKASKK